MLKLDCLDQNRPILGKTLYLGRLGQNNPI